MEWRAVVTVDLSEPITDEQMFGSLEHLRGVDGSLGFHEGRSRVEFTVSHEYESEAQAVRELTLSVLMALTTVGAPVETVETEASPAINR